MNAASTPLAEAEAGPELVPIPSLLLTGAVHHHLIKQKSRTRVGLIVAAGDVRECHHVALLIGYGPPPSTRTSPSPRSGTWSGAASSPGSPADGEQG